MASVHTIPITPTPAFVTESRKVREDDRSIAVDTSVDASPNARKLPETFMTPGDNAARPPKNDPIEDIRPDVRPVIERLDGMKDQAETLKSEEPDKADIALQANDAYQALRQPDEELTPVGTI